VADCKRHYDTSTSDALDQYTCQECDGKDWINKDLTSGAIKITCSSDPMDSTTCKSEALINCDQYVCYKLNGVNVSAGACQKCKDGYVPGLYVSTMDAFATCSETGKITNCETYTPVSSGSACFTCKSDFAVSNAQTACTAFTKDANCRRLGSGDTECQYCWYSYYWSASTCTLKSGLFFLVSSVLALLLAMF